MKTINIGIAGVGRIGKIHLENILGHFSNVNIHLVTDPAPEAEKYVKAKNLNYSREYSDIISNSDIDAVVLCSPTNTHADYVKMAAKAGAAYISPFVGRLDDISNNGMELVEQILIVYENYGFETEVIVASIRNPMHVVDAALMGADIATIPFKVIQQLIKHPLTDIGLEKFLADWKKQG